MAELRWSVDALADLDEIGGFISRRSPCIRSPFRFACVAAAERVEQFPEMGRIVPELGDATLRELIFHSYSHRVLN